MKQKFALAASILAAAAMLASCGNNSKGSSYPSHDGKYDTTESLKSAEDWGKAYGTVVGLAGKKISFSFAEDVKVDVDAHGGTTNFSSFRVDTHVVTTGYIDFSMTDFYLYVKTVYEDKNNPNTNYTKEGLIKSLGDGKYGSITTDATEYTEYAGVQVAFGATFDVIGAVANTKATRLGSDAFIMPSAGVTTWLYKNVGLSSTSGNKLEDWEDCKIDYGKAADGSLVMKTMAPRVGYTTDQGVSDFGGSNKDGDTAYVQAKVGTDGYVTDWHVDYNGDKASLDFAIMNPAPTVIVKGSRGFNANYAAAAQEHVAEIDHKQPEAKKYTGYTVTADAGVAKYSASAFLLEGQNATGFQNITFTNKTELADNTWVALSITPVDGAKITSVKVGDKDCLLRNNFYCAKATEGTVDFVITTDSTNAKATAAVAFNEEVTGENVVKYLDVPAVTTILDIEEGGMEAKAGRYFVLKPTVPAGKAVAKVTVNGVDVTATAKSFGGYYGIEVKTGGLYMFNVLLEAAA